MAMLETGSSTGLPILRPEVVEQLVTIPWTAASYALANTTLINAVAPTVRLPIVVLDLASGFVNENQQISPTDPDLAELCIVLEVQEYD